MRYLLLTNLLKKEKMVNKSDNKKVCNRRIDYVRHIEYSH